MTYKGLTIGEWYGGWVDVAQRRVCAFRGHPWGPWMLDAEDVPYGPASRMCDRCSAYELREQS